MKKLLSYLIRCMQIVKIFLNGSIEDFVCLSIESQSCVKKSNTLLKNQNEKKGNKMNYVNFKSVYSDDAIIERYASLGSVDFKQYFTKVVLYIQLFMRSYTIKSKRKNKKVKFRKSFNKKYILDK